MRKIASHYLITNQLYRFHYIVIENGQFLNIHPFDNEEAGIEFRNGLLWIIPASFPADKLPWISWVQAYPSFTLKQLIQEKQPGLFITPGEEVIIYHFPDLSLTASELGTNNSRSNPHVQRL